MGSLLLTLTYFTACPRISIVNFEHVIASWVEIQNNKNMKN